jgi:hypothetical protein
VGARGGEIPRSDEPIRRRNPKEKYPKSFLRLVDIGLEPTDTRCYILVWLGSPLRHQPDAVGMGAVDVADDGGCSSE